MSISHASPQPLPERDRTALYDIVFAFNNIADSVFYGRGRTDLMLYQSLIVNTIFYGGAFFLYRAGLFSPDLIGIAIMFGTGIALDSLITFVMFHSFWKNLAVRAVGTVGG